MHTASCWQWELSTEEPLPAQAFLQADHAFICLNSQKFLNLQVFCATIDEHFHQKSSYSTNSCRCYPIGFLLPMRSLSLYQAAPFLPGYFSSRPV